MERRKDGKRGIKFSSVKPHIPREYRSSITDGTQGGRSEGKDGERGDERKK